MQSQNDVFPNAVAGRPWSPSPGDPTPPVPMLYWDRVSYSGWSFDLHNPKGMLDPDHPPFVPTMTPYMFSTPLRSLVSKDVTNLFFAGRLASFSHVVYGSQRVMRTCSTMGQAVGTAAAYAVSHGLAPIELQDHRDAVWSIQQQLLRDDAFIIGVLNEDPRDLARTSTVTATSETDSGGLDGRASNVISGQSRAVTGNKGVAPGQGLNGTNRWISTALPAALTLQLATPQSVAQVQLVFDTGMHRKLNFNPVGNPKDALHWSPQPETVRDYVIEGRTTDGWVPLCNVTANYLRRRVHSLPCASEPGPGPAPPPAPPAVAPGALVADLCTAAAGQMWTLDHTGEVSTVVGTNKFCLGYSSNLAAFGGTGRAVVALPCGQGSNTTAWSLKPSAANDTGAFLQAVPDVPCFSASKAACDASKASSVTIAGAGDAGFNGLYVKDEKRGMSGGFPVFTKDAAHDLYRYGEMWHLGSMGSSVSCKRHCPPPPPLPMLLLTRACRLWLPQLRFLSRPRGIAVALLHPAGFDDLPRSCFAPVFALFLHIHRRHRDQQGSGRAAGAERVAGHGSRHCAGPALRHMPDRRPGPTRFMPVRPRGGMRGLSLGGVLPGDRGRAHGLHRRCHPHQVAPAQGQRR